MRSRATCISSKAGPGQLNLYGCPRLAKRPAFRVCLAMAAAQRAAHGSGRRHATVSKGAAARQPSVDGAEALGSTPHNDTQAGQADAGEPIEQEQAAAAAGAADASSDKEDAAAGASAADASSDQEEDEETAEMLAQIQSSIALALARFSLDDLLVPLLQRRLLQGGSFARSFLSYSIYLNNICLLCDPRVFAQWCQGVATCYMLTAWLLGVDQLALQTLETVTKWQQQGPPLTCSRRLVVMQMSVAGDFLSAMRGRFSHAGKRGSGTGPSDKAPSTTRELLLSCPWMVLSEACSDARENRATLRLPAITTCASRERLEALLLLLDDAVYAAFGVSKAGAAASAGLVAAVAAEAVGAKDVRKIRQGILAAAARSAVRHYISVSPAKLGRVRYMLQHGVPVGVMNLVKFIQDSSPVGQKSKERKRGPASSLDYLQTLPGLGPVQVVTISSAASPAYRSMLQHMAAVSLLGMDTESSWLGEGASVTVVLSFMAPAVPGRGTDAGWPDTVYIIDLVAAGMQQHIGSSSSSSSSSSESAAAELVAGLAAVFEDPGCTLVVQDASQDLPLLHSEFGLSAANVIDSQLAFMLLEAVQQQQGLHVRGRPQLRRRLEVLLAAYGLAHPNKMEVVAMTKSTPMLWLTAPRPLAPELLSYLVADVRYLPALVLLMERDLLQASPGQLQQLLLAPAKPAYQLLVPQGAVGAAERAVAAAAAAAAAPPVDTNGAGNSQKQQQQQQQQHNRRHRGIGTEWRADSATEHLLSLLPERLSGVVRGSVAAAAASAVKAAAASAAALWSVCRATGGYFTSSLLGRCSCFSRRQLPT
ncbi:hypothetical protein OEZ85_007819 [Tetradesmus obliquus]|uniref:3'-5' exonuclease domain-containing protein n=1 Tax=Tetradesmus obliquus TaxID=3088 RepID=A0ABY8THA0_TETOB|nr:hypothetical protein OEZ85_007819 [Tetradesmus obliquus]